MKIIESYATATRSSNLRSDEFHHAPDKLAAVAMTSMSAQCDLAAQLFRVKYANDAASYPRLAEEWAEKVAKKASLRKWPRHIPSRKVAEMSLNYWLNSVCEVCAGTGYASPLADSLCKCCKGEKKKPLICEANWRDYVLDMLEDIEEMARYAAGKAMKKLAIDMQI